MREHLPPLVILLLAAACTPALPPIGDGGITCSSDKDCQPGEFCDLVDSPHFCFALPPDGGDGGVPDAGDGGGVPGPDAGDAGPVDAGIDAGCFIGGQQYTSGTADTSFACAVCDPATSGTNWSAASDGTACTNDGGTYCMGGGCVPSCLIGGALVLPGATAPGNGCQVCNPDAGSTAYTDEPELTACADAGNFCHAGECQLGCGIDGGFVASWTPQDAIVTGCCNPALSATNWTPAFGTAREVTLTSHPSGLTVADFNGDGLSDFAVTQIDNTVDVYLSHGDGGFSQSALIASAAGPGAMISAVFTSSGNPDLAVLEQAGPGAEVFHGLGNGTFSDAGILPTTGSPKAITAAVLEPAALPDLVVAQGTTSATAAVWTNTSGSFGSIPTSEAPLGASPLAVAAGQFTAPGTNDLVALAKSGNEFDFLPNSSGSFSTKTVISLPQTADTLAVASFGALSSVVVGGASISDGGYVQVWFSQTDGGFVSSSALWLGAQSGAIAAFRRDGGSSDSLASADSQTGDVTAIAFLDGGLAPAGTYPAGSGANAISTGDFNGDGLTDLAVSDPSSSVYILYGQCR